MLDGESHRSRKSLLMSVFTESAMESYIEPLRAIFHKHFLSVAFSFSFFMYVYEVLFV
jgi:cytochrome P450